MKNSVLPFLNDDTKDQLVIQAEAKKKQEFKYIGSQRRIKGLTLFSYNTVTKELKPASIKSDVSIGLDGSVVYSNKAQIEKDCVYFQALNIKNARKKIQKEYQL